MIYRNSLAAAISFTVGITPAWAAKSTSPPAVPLSDAFNFANVRGKHTATNGTGLFINVWSEGTNIYARYTQNGAVSGDRFLVANDFGGLNVAVTMNSNGDAVVAWEGGNGVTAQIIPANTTLLTPSPITVGEGNFGSVSVSMDDEGDFVVGWSGSYSIEYPDSDGDGYYDKDDACPTEGDTQGYGVNSVGCPLAGPDRDGDDVIDAQDLCPDLGDEGYGVDATGCPLPDPNLDTDTDGVIDTEDHCPLDGDAGYGIDVYGCPLPNPDPDNDDVLGDADHCPLVGDEGYGVDVYGCPVPPTIDTDADGLGDAHDNCPTQGDMGYGIDLYGCPIPAPVDTDGDGVFDPVDLCPSQGDAGHGIDGDGCPLPPPAPFRANVVAVPENNVLIRAFHANGLPVSDRPTSLAENGCYARPYAYGGYYGYTPGCNVDVSISKQNEHGVVTWNTGNKLVARRFNAADASLIGDEIRVDGTPASKGNNELTVFGEKNLKNNPATASVAIDNSGNFSVAWSLISTAGQRKKSCYGKGKYRYCYDKNMYSTVSSVVMQRFDANNKPAKAGKSGNIDIPVQKGKKNSSHFYPQISVNNNGDLAIGWENMLAKPFKYCYDGYCSSTYIFNTSGTKAVRYSASKGTLKKVGATIAVNNGLLLKPSKAEAVVDSHVMPSVALDNTGNLQVLWQDFSKKMYPDDGSSGTTTVKAVLYPAR